ncbi:MAG: hypothetical protein HPZ91_04620 [Lentisphaeria bacterium]|nr:hypothetical protein [Lentisphaeria bacterium]
MKKNVRIPSAVRLAFPALFLLAGTIGCTSSRLSPEAEAFTRQNTSEMAGRTMLAIRNAIRGQPAGVNAIQEVRRKDTPPPTGVGVTEFKVGNVPVRLYSPEENRDTKAIVLYIHGGGWVPGLPPCIGTSVSGGG